MPEIRISDIKIGDGRREVDDGAVAELIKSIKEVGLINAITVSADMVLVAGAHRLEAFKRMGRDMISANVVTLDGLRLRLAEIDENIVRKKLHYVDECNQLAERKEIHEAIHPETKKGVAGGVASGAARGTTPPGVVVGAKSFVDDTALKTGMKKTRIFESVQIANSLTDESKQAAKELDLRKKEAIALARMDAEKQREAIKKRAAGEVRDIRELDKQIESGEYKRPTAKPKNANNATIAEATQKLNEIMAPRELPTPDKVANDNGEILAININCFAEGISPYLDGARSLLGISEITKEKIIASALQAIEAMTLLKEMCERGIKQ